MSVCVRGYVSEHDPSHTLGHVLQELKAPANRPGSPRLGLRGGDAENQSQAPTPEQEEGEEEATPGTARCTGNEEGTWIREASEADQVAQTGQAGKAREVLKNVWAQ